MPKINFSDDFRTFVVAAAFADDNPCRRPRNLLLSSLISGDEKKVKVKKQLSTRKNSIFKVEGCLRYGPHLHEALIVIPSGFYEDIQESNHKDTGEPFPGIIHADLHAAVQTDADLYTASDLHSTPAVHANKCSHRPQCLHRHSHSCSLLYSRNQPIINKVPYPLLLMTL